MSSTDTPKRPRKVLIVDNEESEEEKRLSVYREKLTEIIRGVFFYDGELKDVVSEKFGFSKQLTALYNKIKESHSDSWDLAFYDELRLRFNYMVGDQGHDEARHRVLTFIIVFALRLFSSRDASLVSFLVDYCEKVHSCKEVIARQNITSLIGIFFKYGRGLFRDLSEVKGRERISDLRDRLYEMAERRLHDEEAAVRAEVYRAMVPLQDLIIYTDFVKALNRSPTEFILAGLSDISANCRFVALQCIDMSQDEVVYLKAVASLATCDTSTKVRKEALSQLSKVNPKNIDADQLTILLHANLTSPDESIRQFTKRHLISVWLISIAKKIAVSSETGAVHNQKGLGSALMMLMARLNSDTYHEEMVTVCLAGLEVIQRLLSGDSPIGVTEMITFLTEDKTQPRILMRSNRNDLVDTKQTPANVAMKAFLWRCFVQYCHQQTDKEHSGKGMVDEAERDNCLTRLAPTLHDMCLLVESVFAFESECPVDICDDGAEAKNQESKESALLDCLEICTFLEQEATGMEKWKNLLEKLIVDTRMPKRITDRIGHVLVNVHSPDDPLAVLVTIVHKLGDATHKEFDPNATELDHTISLPTEDADQPRSPDREESPELVHHKIKVVLSILRTGRITQMHPYLKTIYHDLVPKCLRLNVMERKYAMEVTGIIACLDAEMASGCSILVLKAFQLDDVVESRVSSIDALCDLLIVYGFEQMEEWLEADEGHCGTLFEEILKDINAEERLYTKAFECCAKMLIVDRNRKAADHIAVERMTAMLARIFHPSTRDAHVFNSCATQFLLLFSSFSRADQQLLCTGVCRLLSDMYDQSRDPFISEVRIEKALATVVALTHASRLVQRKNDDGEDSAQIEPSAHQEFVEGLIANLPYVLDNERILQAHCHAVEAVDFVGVSSEFIAGCIRAVERTIEDDSIAGVKKNADLVKLQKRLMSLEKAAQKEGDSLKREKRKGAAPSKTASRRPRLAKTVNCDETILHTPPVDAAPSPKEMVSTRTRLPRTVKRNVTYDT